MADLFKLGFYWQLRCTNYGIRWRLADEAIRNLDLDINGRARMDNYLFCAFEMYSNKIQNMGRSYCILPVHQVRTVG